MSESRWERQPNGDYQHYSDEEIAQRDFNKDFLIGAVALAISFLLCGCAIYLLFRSKTLNIYHWCATLGFSSAIDTLRLWVQNWNIPDFVKFCLPDGLYCAAYILLIDTIWHRNKGIVKNIIISLVPLVTISSELLQLFGIVRGTFDIYDLVCYSIPPLVYLSIIYH